MAKPDAVGEWSPFRTYGAQKSRIGWKDFLLPGFLGAFAIIYFLRASRLPEYQWQWQLLLEFLVRKNAAGNWEAGLLAKGFFTTIKVGLWTIIFSIIFGGALGIISARKGRLNTWICQIYVNIFRNTPPLVILFAVYFFAGNLLPVTH